ncbi:MAG: adenosylmethionine--8-amino-7-oxononanoate transaminase [Solirubrobacteraceae bacterium]
MEARWSELIAADQAHVWHPYGPMPASIAPLAVAGADGVRLQLADGRDLIDGMASWWCAIHGYRHPVMDAAVTEQLGRMAHVMFGGLTHEGAITLAQRLVEMTPAGLEHVFFSDSGSVSVEVAIKMALQAAMARGPGRTRLLTVRGGYHGDTFGAMAACDPVGGMHHLFAGTLTQHVFAPRPPDGFDAPLDPEWAAAVEELAVAHADELAAVIVEPVVQGAGGMRFHSPECLRFLRECCDRHDLLLILDEIATGFGRSGALFAADHANITPDIHCLGKALTGGYMTLAATLCTTAVADAITEHGGGTLMHGPTFMANPLACAAALASTSLLLDGDWAANVTRIERGLRAGLADATEIPGVRETRVLGAIGVVELDHPVDVAAAATAAAAHGVWVRPFRDLVYVMPPYIIGDDDLATVTGAMLAAARAG